MKVMHGSAWSFPSFDVDVHASSLRFSLNEPDTLSQAELDPPYVAVGSGTPTKPFPLEKDHGFLWTGRPSDRLFKPYLTEHPRSRRRDCAPLFSDDHFLLTGGFHSTSMIVSGSLLTISNMWSLQHHGSRKRPAIPANMDQMAFFKMWLRCPISWNWTPQVV